MAGSVHQQTEVLVSRRLAAETGQYRGRNQRKTCHLSGSEYTCDGDDDGGFNYFLNMGMGAETEFELEDCE